MQSLQENWRYEHFLKKKRSRLGGACVGATAEKLGIKLINGKCALKKRKQANEEKLMPRLLPDPSRSQEVANSGDISSSS